MLGDTRHTPNQVVFDACGGSMAFTIAAVLAGHSVITAEINADQLLNGKARLQTETLSRLDTRSSARLKLPVKCMMIHAGDKLKDIEESRFLPKKELVLGYDADAPEELAPFRKICNVLKVNNLEMTF